jgi:hypothetical protein
MESGEARKAAEGEAFVGDTGHGRWRNGGGPGTGRGHTAHCRERLVRRRLVVAGMAAVEHGVGVKRVHDREWMRRDERKKINSRSSLLLFNRVLTL